MLRRGIALAITAGSLVLTSSQPTATRVIAPRGGDGGPSQHSVYTATSKEFYLTQDQFDFARPGIDYKINGVTIGADSKPVVDVTITDSLVAPVDRLGIQTPGVVTASFVLSLYDPATRNYTSYATRTATAAPPAPPDRIGKTAVQATGLSGSVVDLELGHFKFNASTVLPAGFDQTKTHTIAVYGRRTMPADIMDGKVYIDNAELDFRPDGQAVTAKWDEIQEKNACNQCHDPLAAHGDVRQDAKLCVLCHSPQTTDPDTGNLLDMRVFIHKIHRGENLPSVEAGKPYQIIGFNNTVVDYSTVAFPQDIRNCQNCHEGRKPSWRPAGRRLAVRELPRTAGGPGVRRLDQGRTHAALQVQAAERLERDHRSGRQRRPGQEARRHLQDDRERRHDPGSEEPGSQPQPEHPPRRAHQGLRHRPGVPGSTVPRERERRHVQRQRRDLHVHQRHSGRCHRHLGGRHRGAAHDHSESSSPRAARDLHRGGGQP